MFGWGSAAGGERGSVVNEAVLAELRGIRDSIEKLSERVASAASRDDLKHYATLEAFEHHLKSHERGVENWRAWVPWAISALLALYEIVGGGHGHLPGG